MRKQDIDIGGGTEYAVRTSKYGRVVSARVVKAERKPYSASPYRRAREALVYICEVLADPYRIEGPYAPTAMTGQTIEVDARLIISSMLDYELKREREHLRHAEEVDAAQRRDERERRDATDLDRLLDRLPPELRSTVAGSHWSSAVTIGRGDLVKIINHLILTKEKS